uniref:XPG N-terminal domain-containing protein n=1 Tax=Pectinophora gossypiella TaxID=13191 RepID=A0A1E1WII3_PECGO
MGVTGLWRLIEPAGKPVPVETLENKVLAVDISIWLHQMVKGYQDAKGAPLPNAHLMGLFQRLCKLLYFRIKPVFVFDGAFPDLKKETIARRQDSKAKYNSESERLKRELALLLSKKTAVSSLLGKQISPKKPNSNTANDDLFKLPALPQKDEESESDSEEDSSGSVIDLHSVDLESDNFKTLPTKEKYDLLIELKETRKMNSWRKIHELPKKSDNFSDFQMQRLLKRRKVQECLQETEKEMGDSGMSLNDLESLLNDEGIDTKIESLPTRRIASDNNTRILMIKNVKQALAEAKQRKEAAERKEQNKEEEQSTTVPKKELKKNELEEDLEKAIKMSLENANDVNTSTCTSKTDDSWTSVLTDTDYTDSEDDDGYEQPDMTSAKAYIMQYSDFTHKIIDNIVGPKTKSKTKPKAPDVDQIIEELNHEKSVIVDNINLSSSDDECILDSQQPIKHSVEVKNPSTVELNTTCDDENSPTIMDATQASVVCVENPVPDVIDLDSSLECVQALDQDEERVLPKIAVPDEPIPGPSRIFKKETNESDSSDADFEEVPDEDDEFVKPVVQVTLNMGAEAPPDDDIFADIFTGQAKVESSTVTPSTSGAKVISIDVAKANEPPLHEEKSNMDDEFDEDLQKAIEMSLESSNDTQKAIQMSLETSDDTKKAIEMSLESSNDIQKAMEISLEGTEVVQKAIEMSLEAISVTKKSGGTSFEITNGPKIPIEIPLECSNETEDAVELPLDDSDELRRAIELSLECVKEPEKFVIKTKEADVEQPCSFANINNNDTSSKHANKSVITIVKSKPDVASETIKIPKEPLSIEQLNTMAEELQNEEQDLIQEKSRLDRISRNITEQMTKEAQELLQIFGIPYIVAPMEAEAQCAFLESVNLTDGTITDDSDIWLFGGRTVYKNFFNQKKHVLQFLAERIERSFNLTREQLVLLALLVGSDYTTGVTGVGPVTAMEILASFPFNKKQFLNETSKQDRYAQVVAGLQEFKKWVKGGKRTDNTTLKKKLKNVDINDDFPSIRVVQAYLEPNVEKSEDKFTWGELDITILRDYTKAKFGWSQNKLDEIIKPVIKRIQERKSQRSVQDYFKKKIVFQSLEEQMSKRVKAAVQRMGPELPLGEQSSATVEKAKPVRKRKINNKKAGETVNNNEDNATKAKLKKNDEANVLKGHGVTVVTQGQDGKSSIEINILKTDRFQEIIPQREKEKESLLQNKMKAIELFRKTKIDKKKKLTKRKAILPKDRAELSESSDSD